FLAMRSEIDYEIDGIVFCVNDISEQTRMGASAHHPRWAIAFKFQGESGITTLRDVEWSVSRNGVLTPIGIVDPIKLSGATIRRITLHNLGLLQKLGASYNASVAVMRRGGVIPHIEAVIQKTDQAIQFPQYCPSCHSPTRIVDDFLICTNSKGCRKTKLGELEHFLKVLEIDGFGPKLIEQLYDNGFVEEIDDFFELKKEDLLNLERIGEKLADKLIAHIQAKKSIPLARFLRALGIPELAKHVSEILSKQYKNLDRIMRISEEELVQNFSIGEKIAAQVVDGLQEKKEIIQRLRKHIHIQEKTEISSGKLSGLSFLFTGKLAHMGRNEAQKLVEQQGGENSSGVTRELDYLVIGSEGYKNQAKGKKWLAAEALIQKGSPLKIISEEEFFQMIDHDENKD
ncbi:MAG: hypothetical protein KDK50_06315, partial [Chlamydiia bacterium]|nr:hypothetical protein [Chlamydiia bacterium]